MLKEAIARLSRHTFTYAAAEQVSRLAGFLLIPIITDYLDESVYGTRELVAITLALLAQAAGVNITAAMTRHYFEGSDPARRRRVVSTTLLTVAGVAGFLTLVLFLAAPWVASVLPTDFPRIETVLRIALGIFFFQMLREVQNKYLQVEERSLLFGVLSFSKLIVEISLQIFFLVVLERGLVGLFEAVLISEALFCGILLAITLPRVGLGFSAPIFLALTTFALPLIPNGVLQFCLHSADRYLLGGIAGTRAVGLYGLAYKFGYMPNYLVLGPFLMIWYPFVFSVGDEPRQKELIGRLSPYFLWIMTAMGLVVCLFAREVVETMASRPGYYAAWVAVPLVSLGYWFWALFQIVQTGFYVKKVTAPLPYLTLGAVLVNVYLNLVLVPSLGFLGSALATTLTFAVLALITGVRVREVFEVDYPWRRIFAPLAVAGALFGGALALDAQPGIAPGTGLWIKLAALGLWVLWSWFGGFLAAHERRAILDALRGLRARGEPPGSSAA